MEKKKLHAVVNVNKLIFYSDIIYACTPQRRISQYIIKWSADNGLISIPFVICTKINIQKFFHAHSAHLKAHFNAIRCGARAIIYSKNCFIFD